MEESMDDLGKSLADLTEVSRELRDSTNSLLKTHNQTGCSSISINAGGVAVWAAVTACIATVVVTITVAILFSIWAVPAIRDSDAYIRVHEKQIAAQQREISELKTEVKK